MASTPRLTAKQVIKRLKAEGFVEASQNGSHLKLFNVDTRQTAIVPVHSNKIIRNYSGLNLSVDCNHFRG